MYFLVKVNHENILVDIFLSISFSKYPGNSDDDDDGDNDNDNDMMMMMMEMSNVNDNI